jgi:WD40 repeat protein
LTNEQLAFTHINTVHAPLGNQGDIRMWGEMQVTGLAFLERSNRLLSCSKDSYLKVWELTTQHCSQTIAGYKCAP